LAALKATEQGENPFLLILSSDHIIKNQTSFIKSIEKGLKYAEEGRLVTFGVVPESPETCYGYIESEESITKKIVGTKITRFIEKPNLEKAKQLISNKRFSWNSGIFLFRAKTILKELEFFNPDIVRNCRKALIDNNVDFDFQRIGKEEYLKCENISIDIAVMEKTNLGTVVPLCAGWKDIGSWEHIWENAKKDKFQNALKGKVFLKDCKNSYFRSDERLLVGIGVNDLVAIETRDAVLIIDKKKTQNLKDTVENLKQINFKESTEHKKIFRPWGSYTSLVEDLTWKVKKIIVNPHQSLSLQLHKKRAENWVVVSGIAKVQINNQITFLSKNESAYIPKETKHRLSNPENYPLVLIEIQSGELVDELDIIRFEDNYGRIRT
jgi:mannose-1-phosphate guanylyltransferase